MNALELLTGPMAQAIGWALLHLLWQATIVAGILAAVLALMSRQSANARYVVSCGALALVFALFVATAVRAYDPAAAPVVIDAPAADPQTVKISLEELPALIAQSAMEGARDRIVAALSSTRRHLPLVVGVWLAGVVFLSSRLLVSWMRARRLVRVGAQPATRDWQRVASRLSDALGLRRAVMLLESAAVEVPSVVGSLRPAILIPASALTGLTPEQIEMVLAHELAHIRRHDFLTNLLQAVVETLMFYHPAVWWMSRRVRIERENCCDDMAVAVCGNPVQYARALTRLEELRAAALPVMVAASGGSLLDRIRRIAAGRAEGTAFSSRWAAAVATLVILIVAVAIPSLPALAQREEKKKAEQPAKPASANVEVAAAAEADADHEADAESDAESDSDFDYEFTGEFEAPEPPAPPDIDIDIDIPHIDVPAVAPVPPVPPVVAVPSPMPMPVLAPRPPAPPHIAAMTREHEFEFEHEHDSDARVDREIGSAGKLTVDELISLAAVGVTPEYINTMRGLFPNLTFGQVRSMRAVGVTPEYVREMRAAGYDLTSPKTAISLRAVGVTPEYIKEMRDAGFKLQSADDVTSLRAVGVDAEYVRAMRAAGFELSSAKTATSLRAVGVTPEYVREMRAAGFAFQSEKDITGMRAVGVTPEWLQEMKAAGVDVKTARDATSLRAVGVSADFVKRLARAGYTNLSVRELTRLAAAGIDDDFIRDMEQYRKKN